MGRRAALIVLAVALGGACATGRGAGPRPQASRSPGSSEAACLRALAHEQLQAVLWMQTAAEYELLTRTIYRAATTALAEALADKSWTAAVEQAGGFTDKPPAVIVDIDETVLDNSPFQGQLVIDSAVYNEPTWKAWVALAAARPVPGALDFARAAAERNVAVFYITNRGADQESDTLRNLLCAEQTSDGACSGFPVADRSAILCKGEKPAEAGPAWGSDKTERRRYLADRYRILLLVGDDLRDFLDTPSGASPEARAALAREHAPMWGSRWFLLPNPAYGSWDRALYAEGLDDKEALAAKRTRVRSFRPPAAVEPR